MRKRALRFSIMLAAALAVVPFLPLYIERTMMRSMRIGHDGDVIEWGWRLGTLFSYWSNYRYARPGENAALWLGVNLALALTYALVIALVVDQILVRRKRRKDRRDSMILK